MANLSGANYLNGSVSQNICKFPSALQGVFISSATGATIAIFDDAGTGTSVTIVSSFTPGSIGFYPIPVQSRNGLNVSVAGTITYTMIWD